MQTLRIFLEMIKFKHTLFALPFAYAGALLTAQRVPSLHDLFWITVAMPGWRIDILTLPTPAPPTALCPKIN